MQHVALPRIKTRAPASHDLVRHFHREGWLAQPFPKGQLVRLMISADGGMIFSQAKEIHPKLPDRAATILRNLFRPERLWNVFLCVREQHTGHFWILDKLVEDGESLQLLGTEERVSRLPRYFLCPEARTAPPLTTVAACLKALADGHHLLFRHLTNPGWHPESIVLLTCPKG